MKKKLFLLLAVVFSISAFSTVASAANASNSVEENDFVITMGSSTSYTDETGKVVVEEKILSQEVIPEEELAQGSNVFSTRAASKKTITNFDYFLSDQIECQLTATFSYEPGIGVSCTNKTGKTTIRNSSYEKVREYTSAYSGAANTYVRASYTSVILKPDNNTKECVVWIECTRGGSISQS